MGVYFLKSNSTFTESVKYYSQYDRILSLSLCIITGNPLHNPTELPKVGMTEPTLGQRALLSGQIVQRVTRD